ncbi:hypothetical protein ACI2K4_01170 [Micromonospora sp. NPDC050397]|uniref:hypothetical protein n=1 Tax=Micromonospora sp. NPDC050397 TaxID=3364279 RepID=UPI0038514DB6
MRWLGLVLGKREQQVQHDPGQQAALLQDVRHRFGAHAQVRFSDQVDAITRMLNSDDGLVVAAGIVREFAEDAQTDFLTQAFELHRRTGIQLTVDRRNYRPLWRAAGPQLRWPLFGLPCGFHPYAQVAAAVKVLGAQASRLARVTDPIPVLAQVFEVLDLTVVGWEYGRARVDTDAASLAHQLISTARDIRGTMDDPPPLPPPVREMMRRNNVTDVYDPAVNRVVGAINLGGEMRPALLV